MLGDDLRLDEGRPLEDDRELIAAETADLVAPTNGIPEHARDGGQHVVAAEVAVLVVDALEVVEVDEHERDRRVQLVCQRRGQQLVEPAAVEQPCELVAPAELA